MPIHKIKGAIAIFDLLCDDGNYGDCNGTLIQLYLYLSRVQWERGYHDDAFASLDKALECAKNLEKGGVDHYTAPLVSFVANNPKPHPGIAEKLPHDWPMWTNPDCSEVAKEIKADPRWAEWVKKTQA